MQILGVGVFKKRQLEGHSNLSTAVDVYKQTLTAQIEAHRLRYSAEPQTINELRAGVIYDLCISCRHADYGAAIDYFDFVLLTRSCLNVTGTLSLLISGGVTQFRHKPCRQRSIENRVCCFLGLCAQKKTCALCITGGR